MIIRFTVTVYLFQQLNERLNEIESLKKLKTKPVKYWIDLLKKYLIEAPSAVIKGIPSIAKEQENLKIERERIQEQVKQLGPEGLKRKEEELIKAIEENEVKTK